MVMHFPKVTGHVSEVNLPSFVPSTNAAEVEVTVHLFAVIDLRSFGEMVCLHPLEVSNDNCIKKIQRSYLLRWT